MHVPCANILLVLSLCFLHFTPDQGPICVLAVKARPGHDPLFHFRGISGGSGLPSRAPNLPPIYETGHLRVEVDGHAALRMNPRLAGSGPAPITPLAFHRVHDFVNRRGVPAFRAPNRAHGLPGLLDVIEQGIRHMDFGGQG
uniref:Secreted protein n=1 Tax=Rhipicephalus appendiculatus TaxID=34631 RepID=A0A131YCW9_RHIAP